MKQLLQIIALNLFGLNGLQVALTMGTTVILLQMLLNKISASTTEWRAKKKGRLIESNMWAIE